MESQSEDYAAKLLGAQSHIWNHIFSFINSMSLKCAIEIGILEAIHKYGKPISLSQLIDSLSIHPSKTPFISRLIRILTHSGFFKQQNTVENELEMGYVLTDASILLLKDNPLSQRPFLLGMLDPILTMSWHHFPTWFRNDDPTPFHTAHKMAFFGYAGCDPKFNQFFNDGMASDARLIASVVIEKCKGVFNELESLVDVGGGTGTMAKAIAKSFPQLECTVFDLPHVVADLQGSDNLKYVGGDMFQSIPPADAILFKSTLHDWNDEECVKILKKCKEAIMGKGKEGKLIIIDIVLGNEKRDDESVEAQLKFDMLMMVLLTGKERSEKEWADLIFSAGFSDYKINPVLGLRSLIEVYP
ncbi:probable O-methyltransferase 3 [Gastrolobium bilobum]|uniref:probable O-methyltransferase 3 n=1 Tax=Gastrolobium bilobum TaxID=150636 RepID=UPI002AB1BE9F|nr:probable O-methyltransferase 3 [Gastrolobium bilobum]